MLGGYAAEAEAASIATNLNLPDRILDQPLKTLSGGQRRRIELARILFSDARTMILDEPTNHLDADSVVWLREFLKNYTGGFIVISPRCRTGGRDGQPRLLPGCEPSGHRHLQHGLEELPAPARGRRGAPQEGARQRREEGRRSAAAGGEVRRQGHEGRSGPPDGRPRREAARRPRGRAHRRPGRQAAVPDARSVRPHPAAGERPLEELRLPRDLHRRRPRDRPRFQGGRPRPERRRQDHLAPDARGCRHARHGSGRARPRAADRVLRAGARDHRRRTRRCCRT